MTVKQRILMLKLMEKQKKQPEYTARLGISTGFVSKNQTGKEEKNVRIYYFGAVYLAESGDFAVNL